MREGRRYKLRSGGVQNERREEVQNGGGRGWVGALVYLCVGILNRNFKVKFVVSFLRVTVIRMLCKRKKRGEKKRYAL
jgi:hypothetical protein